MGNGDWPIGHSCPISNPYLATWLLAMIETWDMNFMREGRANLKLKEAIQGGKEKSKQIYPKKDVTTSPVIGCRILVN